LIKRVDHVAEEVKSVSNLNSVWCAQTHAISDAEAAVTRDDLGTRMFAEPGRQGCGLIVGQHVNRPADRQVDEQ